jgi:signal transduction histidine kinase
LVIGSGVFFSLAAVDSYDKISEYQDSMNNGFQLRNLVGQLPRYQFDKDYFNKLKTLRNNLNDDNRKKLLTHVISAYGAKNPKLLSRRVEQYEKFEQKQYFILQAYVSSEKKSLYQNGVLAFSLPLFFILMLLGYLKIGLFGPLKRLSDRMLDFLGDKYSFKFMIPADNEIGDLQRTFNSLAQRVLNNMDELKDLDRAKSEFLSIASHELRTPMTSIKGSLSLLKSGVLGQLDKSSLRLIRIAESESDRLIRLINDLLDLAKIESRSLALKKKWVPLDQLLEKSLEGLIGLAETAEIKLKLQTFRRSIEVNVDEDRFQQIITILVSNAIKFSPQKSEVLVHVHLNQKGELSIDVRDKGPGIAHEDQELIFEKFRQTNGTQESQLVKGTGLGLAIAKALISEHEGQIGVKSAPGQGSIFYVTLKEWRKAKGDPLVFQNNHTNNETTKTTPRAAA